MRTRTITRTLLLTVVVCTYLVSYLELSFRDDVHTTSLDQMRELDCNLVEGGSADLAVVL
jgi:hypothetical protein